MKQTMQEFKEFIQQKRWTVLITMLAVLMCYGKHAFTTNVDIDTEELILGATSNMQGWLHIGRFGGYYTKALTGGMWHNPYFNGVLFLTLFSLGMVLLMFLFWRMNRDFPVMIFGLFYATTSIWCFVIYFSMLQVELAIGILCAIIALHILYGIMTEKREKGTGKLPLILKVIVSVALLVWAFGCYQAILVFYLVAGVGMYVAYYRNQMEQGNAKLGTNLLQIVFLLAHFVVGYGIYSFIANKFFSGSSYLTSQIAWGQRPILGVIRTILAVIKSTYLNDILKFRYLLFPVFALILVDLVLVWTRKFAISSKIVYMFLEAAFVWTPFALTVYMGGDMPYRTKFALALYVAIAVMYLFWSICRSIRAYEPSVWRDRIQTGVQVVLAAAVAIWLMQQLSVNQRLWYTDDVCNEQNRIVAENIYDHISALGLGEEPEAQVVILGRKQVRLNRACVSPEIEMFGASNFRWDYMSPTGCTNRSLMYLHAYTGVDYRYPDAENIAYAIEAGETMPVYPADGYVQYDAEHNLILVKLSDYTEE